MLTAQDQQFTSEIHQLLSQVTCGETQLVNNATATLNAKYYKKPEAIPALVQVATSPCDLAVKQLSWIECRKLLKKSNGKNWESLSVQTRDHLKSQFLSILLSETNDLVRHSLARVISEAANLELPKNRWTDLIAFLYNCCTSAHAAHREIGVYVLYTLFEVIADHLTGHLNDLFALFLKTLSDPESHKVRITTVLVVPTMVQILQQSLEMGDMDGAAKAFEVFDTLLILEAPLLSPYFTELIQFYIGIASNKEFEDSVRVMALSFLMWCSVYKKSKLQKLKLVGPIIASVLPIGAESTQDFSDEADDDPSKLAFQVVSSLATNLPPIQVYPEVMQHIHSMMSLTSEGHRKAAMLGLSVLVDGCSDHMRLRLNEFLPFLCQGLSDSSITVRKAACTALGSIADEIEEIMEYHSTLVPLISQLINDSDTTIHYHAMSALDSMMEGLGDQIMPYLPALMGRLVYLLETGESKIKLITTACLGSVAHSAGSNFAPYFSEVIPRLRVLMTLGENKDDLDLRGVATDTVSTVAEAVGKDMFAPFVQDFMQLCISGLAFDSSRLRECSYCFFAVLARVFKEEFAPFLTVIVPSILHSCKLPEKDLLNGGEEELEKYASHFAMDDESLDATLNVNSAIAEEKETSLESLCELFSSTRSAFLPFVQESVNIALELLDHYHESVRKAATSCLFGFLSTFYKMSCPSPWVPGLPCQVPVHENVTNLNKLVMEGVLKSMEDEDDRQNVIGTLSELTELLKLMGPCILSQSFDKEKRSYLDSWAIILLQILKNEHLCQMDQEEMEDASQDNDDLAEQDALVVTAAADAVGAFCSVVGPGFAPYFRQYLPLISKYYKESKPEVDRNMAIGSLAESMAGLKSGVSEFTDSLLPLFLKALEDPEIEVRSNAAYGIGVIIEHSQMDLTSYHLPILGQLRAMFDTESKTNIVDNTCGAVARILMKGSPNTIPMDQVLPVLLNHLPLKKDFQENEPVYKCLFYLLKANEPFLMSHLAELRLIFQSVLESKDGQSQVSDGIRQEILNFLGH